MDLQDWENRLRSYLPKIELLGEISLSQVEHNELKTAIGDLVKRQGLTIATRCLKNDYPSAFVTYLAFEAALNDELSFWDKVSNNLGLENTQPLFQHNHHWGQIFKEILEQFPNLRRFRGISGLEYVTPIRLHGGIPVHSLPDFFRYILLPSIEKVPFDGMEDGEALKAILQRSATELIVDDIVRHFFKHGGEPAQEFFSKCRRLALLAREGHLLPNPQELGLRPYVLQAFENYQQFSSEISVRRRKPRLYFDPYQPGFRVVLPHQPLTLEQAGQGPFIARLYLPLGNELYAEKRVHVRRYGPEWVSDEVEWLLDEPQMAIQVALFTQHEENLLVSYPLRLLPGEGYPPILAFCYEDNALRPITPALPAQTIWLFYPVDAELHIEGNARERYTLHPFTPPWENWQAQAWDLKNARLIRLLRREQDICPPIPISMSLEPSLEGNLLHPQSLATDEKPLYASLPRLRLPLRDPINPGPELENWIVHVESRYTALPVGIWEGTASDFTYQLLLAETCALVDLTSWLGQTPIGTYNLTISGKGHPLSELPFRICPDVTIEGLLTYYLPDELYMRPVAFKIHMPESYRLFWDGESEGELTHLHNGYGIRLDKNVTQANLLVEIPIQPEVVRLPLHLVAPILRWALLIEAGTALEWYYQPITLPLAKLFQHDLSRSNPRLRIELDIFGNEQPLVALHLSIPGHSRSLQISDSINMASAWIDFDLSAFFDTIRTHQEESVFEVSLELLDAKRNLSTCLTVLRLSQSIDVNMCQFERWLVDGWTIHWKELCPLRHRRMRLWSLWQPWSEPIEISLPDDASHSNVFLEFGWWMHEIPDEFGLPPSAYRAHFVAISPYDHLPLPSFPPENSLSIEMLTPEERLKQIDKQLAEQRLKSKFDLHVEKLCIYHVIGQQNCAQEEIQWCLGHWEEASLLHLEALQRWLDEYDPDPNTLRAFLLYMFCEKSLKKLPGHSKDFIRKYLSNLPKVHTLNPVSSRLILSMAQEPQIILFALRALMQSESEESRKGFWQALEDRRFTENDAAKMLAVHLPFVRQLLRGVSSSPLRTRLLSELSRYCDLPEFIVKTGYFVLSTCGWGRIIDIAGSVQPDQFYTEDESPTISVELLHLPGQKACLHLAAGNGVLLERQGAYFCGCGRFVAFGGRENETVWQEHKVTCEQADKRYAMPAKFAISQPLLYTNEPPLNPFETTLLGKV
jgi:hypothetical protein